MALPGHPAAAVQHRHRAPAGCRRRRTARRCSTTICQAVRVKQPNTSRNASQPKISPDAPMWLVGHRAAAPMLPISQVPKPPRIQMIAVAQTNRDMPASVTRKPSTSAGTVLADQVRPVGVQQRREDDAPQAVGLQRPDAVVVESVSGQLVDELDEVEQRDEGQDGGAADLPRRPLLRLLRRLPDTPAAVTVTVMPIAALPARPRPRPGYRRTRRSTGTSTRRRPPRTRCRRARRP